MHAQTQTSFLLWILRCFVLAVAVYALNGDMTRAAAPSVLELQVKDDVYRGKLLAADRHTCWLQSNDGALHRIEFKDVVQFGKAKQKFRPLSSAELRDKLQREWGTDFEVTGTQHYLVCAAKGHSKPYTQLFDKVYRSFYVYLSTRGFHLQEPKFPMVALVLPNQKSFYEYCRAGNVRPSNTLKGYYHPLSNRVALFSSGQKLSRLDESQTRNSMLFTSPPTFMTPFRLNNNHLSQLTGGQAGHPARQWKLQNNVFASIEANLKQTIIHEAIHQVAFNTGLHSRVGQTPKWIVEGLAMVFESPGAWEPGGNQQSRINRERHLWFREYVKSRRMENSLKNFLAEDTLFSKSVLDAYAESWAFTFFLLETQPAKFERYLKRVQKNDPLRAYPAERRLADFQEVYGDDLPWLETRFLRFMQRL